MFRTSAILGYPAKHSRSPLIHGHWLYEYRLSGAYLRVDVAPDAFDGFVADMFDHGYVGANVTIPHKEAAFRLATMRTHRAERLKAANTLWFDNGVLHADNTDGYGFLANLDAQAAGWSAHHRKAVVLGAGGAARAIVDALLERGFARVVLVNRTLARAQEIAADMGDAILPCAWDDLPLALEGADVLVNTTSLGMNGQPELEIDLTPLPAHAVVNDIVYVPLETGLLKAARQRGLQAVDGLGMLLHQAVPGFERWFGVRPVVTPALRALVIADIEGR